MKRIYESPKAYVEMFTPNEYVAACGDSGKVYKFKCDAGGGVSGSVYLETNKQPGLQKGEDDYLSSYYACGTTHEANSTDGFLDGYYVVKNYWTQEETVTPVIVWRGSKGNNTHCTTNLNMDSWETAKS